MIDAGGVERVLDELWRPGPGGERRDVYAILDAARDGSIHPWIRRRALDHTCLFAGKLAPELAAAAPYLLHLYRRERFTRELLELGWGKSWGIFVAATATMEELRLHFRRFLRVKDERGRKLLFRYYDPRVLRVYLPTCSADELATVFGPVDRLLAESENGASLLAYRRAGGELETEPVPLPAAAVAPAPAADAGSEARDRFA